jgi:hypothetical protein
MSEITEERAARIDAFCAAMKAKLNRPENVAKSDWREMGSAELYARIKDETEELREALMYQNTPNDAAAAASEAVDIANFAFMLWDNFAEGADA